MYSLILHGKRFSELQKWRNLRFVLNPLQNAFAFSNSFSSATDLTLKDGRKGKTFTVSYLVDSLGLTTKLAESISRKVSFEEKRNPDSVLSLFRSHGFTDSQISSVITEYPRLLVLDAEKSIGPKLQFLQSREGASITELTEIVSTVPKILGKKGDKTLSFYYDFVKEIIVADKSSDCGKLCHSIPQENKVRNISVLRELGVAQRLLFPLLLSNGQPVCGKERFEESLKKVVDMGFDPTKSKFVKALCVVYQMSDKTIEEKVQVYKSVGFAVEDVWEMFKKSPIFLTLSENNILNSIDTFLAVGFSRDEFKMMIKRSPQYIGYSAESIKKKTVFLVKEMNWPLKGLVSNPVIFGYSMEKRIVPRCNVIKALMSKGLFGDGGNLPPMRSVLDCTNEKFLKRYVRKHDDKKLVLELMAIFTGDCVS